MANESTLPLELLPEGYAASVYAPSAGALGTAAAMWGCAIFGPADRRLGASWFAYGATPRQAVLNAIAVAVPSSVAASSVADVGQEPGTCGAVHGASQAPETDCYREAQRLRAGIRAFLDGDYPNPRTLAGGSATYQCPHGAYRWDDCGVCADEYFTGLLK